MNVAMQCGHSTPLRSNALVRSNRLDLNHKAIQRHDFMVIAQILCMKIKPLGKYLDLRDINLDIISGLHRSFVTVRIMKWRQLLWAGHVTTPENTSKVMVRPRHSSSS
jgi:hypothetical protein